MAQKKPSIDLSAGVEGGTPIDLSAGIEGGSSQKSATPKATPPETTMGQQIEGFGRGAASSFGPLWSSFKNFAQEPILDHLANAKIALGTGTEHLMQAAVRRSLNPLSSVQDVANYLAPSVRAFTAKSLPPLEYDKLPPGGVPPANAPTPFGRRVLYSALSLAGGDPFSAAKEAAAGRTGEAMWDVAGLPAAQTLIGEGIGRAMSPLVELGAQAGAHTPLAKEIPFLYSDEWYGPTEKQSQAHLTSIVPQMRAPDVMSPSGEMKPGYMMGPGSPAEKMIPIIRKETQAYLARHGMTESDLDSIFAAKDFEARHPIRSLQERNPSQYRWLRGMEASNEIFQGVANEYQKRFQSMIDAYGDRPVSFEGADEYLNDVKSSAAKDVASQSELTPAERTASPELQKAIDNIVNEIDGAFKRGEVPDTIAGIDELRKRFGERANQQYNALLEGKTGADLTVWDANRRVTDALREYEYDALARESGVNPEQIRDFQRQNSLAVKMNQFHALDLQRRLAPQASHEIDRMMQVLGGKSEERYPSWKRGMLSAFLKGPVGEHNVAMRSILTPLERAGDYPAFNIGPETYTITHEGPLPQLPPIQGPFDVRTAGAPEVTGGVFPNRESGLAEPTKIPSVRERVPGAISHVQTGPNGEENVFRYPGFEPAGPLDPRTPEHYSYHRNPFFVTDYVGSGKFGEEPVMPGTGAGYISISTPHEAESALREYRKFENTEAYKKMAPRDRLRFNEERRQLESAVRGGKGQLQAALRGYEKFEKSEAFKNLDPADQTRFREEKSRLEAAAKQGEVGRGPSRLHIRAERKTEYVPEKMPENLKRRKLTPLGRKVARVSPRVAGQVFARTLPGLNRDERK